MKPFFTFLFLSVFCTAQLLAKDDTLTEDFPGVFGVGLKGGVNLSNVKFSPDIYSSPLTVYNFGAFLNYLGEPHAGIQIEFNFSQKGWQDNVDSIGQYSRIINYFEIPLLSHFEYGKKVRFVFDLGPYIAFHMNSKESIEFAENSPGRSVWGSPIESDFDYGFLADGGLGWSTKAGSFVVNVRYVRGLANIFTKYPGGNYEYRYSNNSVISFNLVYQYSIKRK